MFGRSFRRSRRTCAGAGFAETHPRTFHLERRLRDSRAVGDPSGRGGPIARTRPKQRLTLIATAALAVGITLAAGPPAGGSSIVAPNRQPGFVAPLGPSPQDRHLGSKFLETLYRTPIGPFRAAFPSRPRMVTLHGYSVLTATLKGLTRGPIILVTSNEGLYSLVRHRPVVCLVGLRLADGSGPTALKRLTDRLHEHFVRSGHSWVFRTGWVSPVRDIRNALITRAQEILTPSNVYYMWIYAPTEKQELGFLDTFSAPGVAGFARAGARSIPLRFSGSASTLGGLGGICAF